MKATKQSNPALTACRVCSDLGLYAIDRPIGNPECGGTCRWASEFCKAHCYNLKLDIAGSLHSADKRLTETWEALDGDSLAKELPRKRRWRNPDRIRLCTRGEAFSTAPDVDKVRDLAMKNPEVLFWIPTRAWRGPLRRKVRSLANLHNMRILASLDPSNSRAEVRSLQRGGWSTMFFGDDTESPQGPGAVRCAKTWHHLHDVCRTCTKGCFSSERVDVWLKEH